MSYAWDKFTRKIYIKAPIEQVFRAWTGTQEITSWFIKECRYTGPGGEHHHYAQIGDDYYWRWHQDLETSGTILDVVPNELFAFTFGRKEKDSEEYVRVEVVFGNDEKESWYTLTQSNMGGPDLDRAQYHLSCNMGWGFFMTNMKAQFEHGADLRELDQDRAYETRAMSL
ncbi:MAG: SRPBCC family protein [Candidatus Kariarchaeaceae archaeon]|jgi:uncharacterized protein YndB with AHSA1/START domain